MLEAANVLHAKERTGLIDRDGAVPRLDRALGDCSPEFISVWQLGSAHRAGYLAVIHLGSVLNPRRIVCLPSPASTLAAGRPAFVWLLRNFFRAALSAESGGPARRFLDA